MKNFTRIKAKKHIGNKIKQAEKLGLNITKITQDKSIETLAFNQNTLNEFNKRFKRQKELPKTILENKINDKKLYEKKVNNDYHKALKNGNISDTLKAKREKILEDNRRDFKRNYISNSTKAIAKFNLNIEPSKHNITKVTKLEADKFFDKYFKSVRGDVAIEKKIDNLKNRFGNRLDLLHEFIDKVTAIDFHYEIDGMVFDRGQFETDFAENWNDMMESRLEKMQSLLNTKEFNI